MGARSTSRSIPVNAPLRYREASITGRGLWSSEGIFNGPQDLPSTPGSLHASPVSFAPCFRLYPQSLRPIRFIFTLLLPLPPHLAMSFSDVLSAILDKPTTVKFVPGTDQADFGPIDLASNPQKTPQGFGWFLPNRVTEATVTFIGCVVYDVIGDKTGKYFSLPGEQWVCTTITLPLWVHVFDILPQLPVVTAEEMAKAKIGFAIRLFNRDLPEDESLPDKLFEHNQALLEFFMTVQEEADERMDSGRSLLIFLLAVHHLTRV